MLRLPKRPTGGIIGLQSYGCKLALGTIEFNAYKLVAKDMDEVKAGFSRVS